MPSPPLPWGRPLVPAALLAPTAARLGAASARRATRSRTPPRCWSHDCRRAVADVAGGRIGAGHGELVAAVPPPTFVTRAVAALASALLSLATVSPAWALGNPVTPDVATITGDALLTASKKADAAADVVVGAAARLLPAKEKDAAAAAAARAAAVALLHEVHDVVATNYMDARGPGLDAAAWDAALEKALIPPPRDADAAHRAVRRMLAFGLDDPYTRFLSPDEFRAMARYDVTGVGLNLGTGDEYERRVGQPLPSASAASATKPTAGVWVIGLVRGSPADAAGVGQGDRVVGVGGARVADSASPFSVSTAIATAGADGASKTRTVTLDIVKPDGRRVTAKMAASTAPAAVSPVSWRLVPPPRRGGGAPAAIIHLDSFNARAKSDVEAALTAADAAGAGSIVLDLRGNRGGLVTEGVEVAGLFLEPGAPVAVTLGARPDAERVLRVGGNSSSSSDTPLSSTSLAKWRRAPLTVLVDDRTASAAEIVAGALRDNCRAVVAGGGSVPSAGPTRTYGKGLIQSVYELGDASGLVLTVGKYLTPSRVDIDRGGIAADVVASPAGAVDTDAADAVLGACRRAKAAVSVK